MVGAAAHRDLLLPRPPGGMGAGALLALIVHAGLIAALAFSVRWRTSEPEGVEAELWAAVPQVAAPEPKPAPPPEPKPVPPPEPKPAPPPPEPKPEPPAVPKAEPPPDAQIAIERERRERLKREAEEQAAREKAERERIERERAEREKAEREKAEREKAEREKAEREKAEREKIAREKAEREKAERERREAEKLAQLREENLQRMRELAGETRPSTGTAATTAGPSASYAGRIRARVKPNIVFTDIVSGNPVAVVEVRAAPDGTIVGRRLVKSSGVPAWDEAVLRAIDKTEVLPRDTDGRVPSPIEIAFRARE